LQQTANFLLLHHSALFRLFFTLNTAVFVGGGAKIFFGSGAEYPHATVKKMSFSIKL